MRWRTILLQYCFLLVTCVLTALEAVPIDIDKTKVQNIQPVESAKIEAPDTGLYYDEYLKQVIDVLETDKHFREKLQKADIEEIKVSYDPHKAGDFSAKTTDATCCNKSSTA
ncbi:PREDICTED: nucleobindin-2-like [Galeopterus variegatus]|uniref:Nucleobindin-2-like n=1 Tax=Galeopterus variegatus TaxID=482537 RepID=A0ABM0RBE3_GALVR|nr:PREDICTED: nucleobindin-2-like [Galeopterus variegatus]